MESIRDAYFVAYRSNTSSELHMNDKVYISDELEDNIMDCHYDLIGTMSNYLDDIYEVDDIVAQLRKDRIIPVTTSRYIYCNIQDVIDYDLADGVIVYNGPDFIIGYIGPVELREGTVISVLDDLDAEIINHTYEDDVYSITEEGLKYLKELEESWSEPEIGEIGPIFARPLDECIKYATETIDKTISEACKMSCEREERNSMDNLFGNLGFGKANTNRFKLSMNGIAVKKDGGYVVYNKDTNEFVDVSNIIFDIKDAIYILPSVEVNAGDMVIHEGLVYTIVSTKDGEIKAVSYEDCTQTILIPKSTMFGIKYFNKVFSILGDNFAASKDIFSNPMMLMALIDGKDSGLSNIMLMNAMSSGDLASNPMALAMMLKGDKSDDSLSTLAFMSMFNNGTNPFAPKKANKEKTNN